MNTSFGLKALSLAISVALFAPVSSVVASEENPRERLFQTASEPGYTPDDIEAEIVFGRELSSKILGKYPVSKNSALNTYVNKVGQTIAVNSQRTEIAYYFVVLDTPLINAFSAPGGYVFITQGALNQVQDESELAAILAHEIGHIEARHYVKKIGLRSEKSSAEGGLTAALAGGGVSAAKAFNEAVNLSMEILFSKGLQSETDEFQSDESAVWILANSGYDPTALERYFNRIVKIHNSDTATLDKTHPPMSKRINQLEQLNVQNQLDKLNYARLQERFNEYK